MTPLSLVQSAPADPGLVAAVRVKLGSAVSGLEVWLAAPGSPVSAGQAGPSLARLGLLLPLAGLVQVLAQLEVAPLSGA